MSESKIPEWVIGEPSTSRQTQQDNPVVENEIEDPPIFMGMSEGANSDEELPADVIESLCSEVSPEEADLLMIFRGLCDSDETAPVAHTDRVISSEPQGRTPGQGYSSRMWFKYYKCPVCFAPFSSKKLLQQHVIVHNAKKPFTCNICQRAFVRNGNLKRHRKILHDEN